MQFIKDFIFSTYKVTYNRPVYNQDGSVRFINGTSYKFSLWIVAKPFNLMLKAYCSYKGKYYSTWFNKYYPALDLDYSQIDDIEVDGINTKDYPDFCDAYICNATYKGRDMTERELDQLNEDRDFVYECVQDRLY